MQLQPFDFSNRAQIAATAEVWNAACGKDLSISPAIVAYNTRKMDGMEIDGRLAIDNGRVTGFALVSWLADHPEVSPPDQGWIEAVAVQPEDQRRGTGSQLMDWAEGWLKKRGVKRALLGGGIHPFAPSLPEELPGVFFEDRGFVAQGESWDVARDLGDGKPIARKPVPPLADLAQAKAGDEKALDEFLSREFPGEWQYEAVEFLKAGGSISDFVLLRQVGRVEGFAWLTFPESRRPLDRYYMQRLPRPWGQLGPIGVARHARGAGWGGLLLQTGLMTLRQQAGVRGCVIDWTGLLEFYGKFGFKPYRRYRLMAKSFSGAF